MLDQQITALRTELNNMLLKDVEYGEVYTVSIALDKLIAQYYRQQTSKDVIANATNQPS